ncbi:hypothetical protein [Streptomyces sp. NBC_00344]|uniref:hypothetical protein n=1 Tax=Streptomyces sp. NBC_00344 TaxID=2975720 RepID=UPI002E21361A
MRRAHYGPVFAAAAAAAAVAGVTACDPVGGLDTASVAYTTDRTATSALEHHGVGVQWLSCTADDGKADYGHTRVTPSPSASARSVAKVDCQGRTKNGKDITVKGKVTKAVDGRCVRGDLTGRVGGELAFRATLLGNCDAAPTSSGANPPGTGGGARPTVTVTVTVTQYPGK